MTLRHALRNRARSQKSPEDAGNLRGLAVAVSTVMGGGVGTGIGAAVDALNRHYNTRYRASSRVVRVAPFASPTKAYGAVVSIVW